MRKILIATVFALVFQGCKGPDNKNDKITADPNAEIRIDEPVGNAETMAVAMAPPVVNQVKFPPPVLKPDLGSKPQEMEKKIIKEGELRFKTADITAARKALVASLVKLGGYVSEESENNYDGQKEITLNTRIPAKNFDAFLTAVSTNAESIDSKNIRIKDVTTEFIDVTTQLANKKKLEARYLELLNKGSKVSDLLEIEDKLTEIRSSIESTQGQLNYLSKQVAYSSLNITFYSKQTVQDNGQTFGYKIKNALTSGWYTLGGMFFGFVAWWPIWLVLVMVVYAFRKWRKSKRKE
ncbi:DUF4349 domain-containing protein [Mucilaginibacter auburnensis]|uniref:Uncharacterized protein DUF4349 n=1 Tax=Mucilaginibacter auburnensis TaxID=1457233 RepID=A0A2H9VQD8_9SPHI|nr:DUF4349 domain-containing protein [Mucilaginibacter auburnensis]PJJ83029.1 uncharacterized protein DUF4349 [Mucilaginibacter auburnensis]